MKSFINKNKGEYIISSPICTLENEVWLFRTTQQIADGFIMTKKEKR